MVKNGRLPRPFFIQSQTKTDGPSVTHRRWLQNRSKSFAAFVENIAAFVYAFTQFFLLFNGKVNEVLALLAAAAIVFLFALFALDKQQVTTFVGAVHMGVGGLTALVAAGNHFIGDPFAQAVVENKILSVKFYRQLFILHLVGVVDDAAFEVND